MDGARLCLNSVSWNDEEPLFFLVTQAEFSWPMFFLGGRSWRSLRAYRSEECHWFLQTCQEESGGQGASFGVGKPAVDIIHNPEKRKWCDACPTTGWENEFLLSLPFTTYQRKGTWKRHETLQDKGYKGFRSPFVLQLMAVPEADGIPLFRGFPWWYRLIEIGYL